MQLLNETKILIADDDESMRILLREAVTRWGFFAVEAKNGEEAWKILQEAAAPRLLILDWKMPKLDGIALCERIHKELTFKPYIIFLSQVSGAENILKGFDAGADEFLLKPVNFGELRSRLIFGEKILGLRSTINEQEIRLEKNKSYIRTLEQMIVMLWNAKK